MDKPAWLEELDAFCGTCDPLELALRGGLTRRFHTQGTEFNQNVAEHTWRVLVVFFFLWPEEDVNLFKTILFHDIAEGVVGDLPAPIKRMPEVKAAMARMEEELMNHIGLPGEHALSRQDHAKLKCADYLELALTCAALSNAEARRIRDTALGYVRKLCEALPAADSSVVHLFIEQYLTPLMESPL